jgi:UDP-glucose 4,6-dehydratase
MFLLLGSTGFVGRAFAAELRRRRRLFIPLSRSVLDYSNFDRLFGYIRRLQPEFVINAAGFPGQPNIDLCEHARETALFANMLLPQQIGQICSLLRIPWGHVSSGGIFCGAKVRRAGKLLAQRDLAETDPDAVRGFSETDEPNFSFLAPPCAFYSGTKALGEKAISGFDNCYIWRPALPFSHLDHPRNFLSKLQRYPKVYDQLIGVSHSCDFAAACLDLWDLKTSFGTYHGANPGFVTTRHVTELIREHLTPHRTFEFWESDSDFYAAAAKDPRPNCLLDVSKLLNAGVAMRSAEAALTDALHHWVPANPPFTFQGAGADLKIETLSA